MAHATIEWTDNLADDLHIAELLELVAAEMRDRSGGVFPVGGIRVRGIRLTDYVIADSGDPSDAFVNIDIKMGAGRPDEFRKAFFDALFCRVKDYLDPIFKKRGLALSIYVEEVEGWKHNSIHRRLGKAG